jgi:hypothetical protein
VPTLGEAEETMVECREYEEREERMDEKESCLKMRFKILDSLF